MSITVGAGCGGGAFPPVCPVCQRSHPASNVCPDAAQFGQASQEQLEQLERDRKREQKVELWGRDAAPLRGWICPVCGGGNAPTAARCPCVLIPLRLR